MENGNARDKTLSTQLKFLKLSLEKVFCVKSLSQSICSKINLFSGASSIYGAELTENKFKQRNLGGIPGGEIFKRESNQFQKTFSQVRLPRHWDFSVCSGPTGQRRTTYARPSQPTDILIGRSHPIFGNNPWSLQNDGCGERGLVLNLPFAFLGAGVQPDPNSHKGRWA